MKIKAFAKKAVAKVKEISPELMIAGGVVGLVGATVLACKATLKIDEIMEDTQDKIDQIDDAIANGKVDTSEYTNEDYENDIRILKRKSYLRIARLYAPAVALAIVSILTIIYSNKTQRARYGALATSYAALLEDNRQYREKVKALIGEEAEKNLRYGLENQELAYDIVNEDGTVEHVEEIAPVMTTELDPHKIYSRYWSDSVLYRKGEDEYNDLTLNMCNSVCNNNLAAYYFLSWNDILKEYGYPWVGIGQRAGLVRSKKEKTDEYLAPEITTVWRTDENGNKFKDRLIEFNINGDAAAIYANEKGLY